MPYIALVLGFYIIVIVMIVTLCLILCLKDGAYKNELKERSKLVFLVFLYFILLGGIWINIANLYRQDTNIGVVGLTTWKDSQTVSIDDTTDKKFHGTFNATVKFKRLFPSSAKFYVTKIDQYSLGVVWSYKKYYRVSPFDPNSGKPICQSEIIEFEMD